ncbi:MAG: pyridoxal phosphate-dependent aminotransferase [Clostridium sp.]|nr:pyridoxal phosphate-dependent aminotransferase [Clostridium sp.]
MKETIVQKFAKLGIDNAPGQEELQKNVALDLRGEKLEGPAVDFSHGDVDAHVPTPGSLEVFIEGVHEGGHQAYTPYRGKKEILVHVAEQLAAFSGAPVDPESEIILTPGTQGALFLAMGANIMPGDKVAIVEPDYFANRKMVEFFGGEMIPVAMHYENETEKSGIDLKELEEAFRDGAKLFLFSNPNNPVGCIYSREEILSIAKLAKQYGATLIVDELYSRQVYPGTEYTHLRAQKEIPDNLITIIGPSKTESLSGYRLGVAYGTAEIIERMEKLQAIMALRCSGYNQAVFKTWFNEPEGWMKERVAAHQAIRDAILEVIHSTPGVSARPTQGGSYLFVKIPELEVSLHQFIRIVRELANVTVTPGTEFGPQFTQEFRINFSQDKEKAVAAMKRLFAVMDRYRRA